MLSVDHGHKYAKGMQGVIFSDHIAFALSQRSGVSVSSCILIPDATVGEREHFCASQPGSSSELQGRDTEEKGKTSSRGEGGEGKNGHVPF